MDDLAKVKYLWQSGKLVELENAKVHVLTPTFFGVQTFLRVYVDTGTEKERSYTYLG